MIFANSMATSLKAVSAAASMLGWVGIMRYRSGCAVGPISIYFDIVEDYAKHGNTTALDIVNLVAKDFPGAVEPREGFGL